jgi:glycosyltransferase involved in cell wall biosynthesis
VTVSESDRRLLVAANPRLQVDVVPNGVDTRAHRPLKQEEGSPALVFVGNMDYLPCADAVLTFCRDVLPRIRQVMAKVEMWIVGINPGPKVRALEGNGVHVTGLVEDVRPYYGRSTVCVVPLRAGGGTRLKILEAMAFGRPVVSTTIGCEGLGVVDGEHLLIADRAEDFAARTLRLLTDEKLRQSIANRARAMVESRYDWDIIAKRLMQVYAEVAT